MDSSSSGSESILDTALDTLNDASEAAGAGLVVAGEELKKSDAQGQIVNLMGWLSVLLFFCQIM